MNVVYIKELFNGGFMRKRASSARSRELLEELAQSGSPVDLSVADADVQVEKVEIEQVGGIHDSRIFELQDGRWAFMVDLAVTNQTSRTIDVVEVGLHTAWDDDRFEWLTAREVKTQVRGKRRCYQLYKFPGSCGLDLPYDDVINHYLIEHRRLPAKRRLNGWLLGIGGLMPPELLHGKWVNPTLAIIGADHGKYSTTIHLWTDRLEARPKNKQRRTSLFVGAEERESMPVVPVSAPRSAGVNRSSSVGTTNQISGV
jgi:hypothetical protein